GLIGVAGASGRMEIEGLKAALAQPDSSYRQSPAALTLTNATEYGTVYSVDEIAALAREAKQKGLPVHLDGARLANAAAAGLDLKAIKTLGIDI
ncbi:threonine aldolase, partial [Pseudomonas sp. FW306-2-11AB]|uniref:beta-eliminating lyase-related protein n=1 Tax=Pseudomonas sp. FW306-2-11AB TaxID=2070660 RepID=UPI000CC4CB0B